MSLYKTPSGTLGARASMHKTYHARADHNQRTPIDITIIKQKLHHLHSLAKIELRDDTHRTAHTDRQKAHDMLTAKPFDISLFIQDRIIHCIQLREMLRDMVAEGKHLKRQGSKEKAEFETVQKAFHFCWDQAQTELAKVYKSGTPEWKVAMANQVMKEVFKKSYMV